MSKQSPEQRRANAKRTRLWVLYRITPEEQDRVEEYQRNVKYSVLLERGDGSKDAKLFTDHRHSDGLIRGRLAYLINKALGTFENSYKERTPLILRTLADYLEKPPFQDIYGRRYGLLGRAKQKRNMIYGPPKKERRAK